MILLILEAHGALDFGGCIDEGAQGVAGQRMIVAAGADVIEPAGFVVVPLGIDALEEEALTLVGGVEGVAILLIDRVGISLQDGAKVRAIGAAILVDDFTEDHYLARTEDIGGTPIEGGPVDAEAQIALFLGGKAADGGAVEGEIIPAFGEELLVVIEHVQAAFEVAKQHGDGLDPF